MTRIGRAVLVSVALLSACAGEDDESTGTLETLDAAGSSAAPATTLDDESSSAVAASGPPGEAAGTGSVSIRLRFAASGMEETVELDLASIAADDLDPISLFASCTGVTDDTATEGFTVNVTDLRRLASDRALVAVELAVAGPVDQAGEYQATLEVSDATQTSTSYTGTATLERGLRSGGFDVVDERGNAATGTFACSTAAAPADAGVTTGSVVRRPRPATSSTTTEAARTTTVAPTTDR